MKRNIFFLLVFSMLLSGCSFSQKDEAFIPEDFTEKESILTSYQKPPSHMTIGMIGDILLHEPLYTYDDYAYSFEEVKAPLEEIDFLLANQESMPSGDLYPYSGYPAFNSPAHIIDGLKNVGVDMVSIANNHTLDRSEKGILAAIENIKSYDMPYVGAYMSDKDQNEPRIVTVNGITLGVLAYTYGTNGILTPKGKDYLVARIDPERISREVAEMKELVDVAVVSMHWGNEYELTPNQSQIDLARVVADAGGDIIFGHHPHVLQQFDILTGKNGNDTHVFYSLGNFYSGQSFDYTDIGGIARLTIEKNTNIDGHPITIHQNSFYPTAVIEDDKGIYKVVPLLSVEKDKIVTNDWVLKHMNAVMFE
ncbi:CapA family protein [Sporosarcina sp. G11-34]|uniref:CapA family protein n=1 Tax=Sporosarcina sp. G11-34 TaxID=2849605 RepID=UPI0022A8EC34|nr:CapA family protein [Sporosarcina sp. G11-34]MCZ2258664.1 CapA family protein [Sporosarcina sp. G11-34]